jgi:hypothetical protein
MKMCSVLYGDIKYFSNRWSRNTHQLPNLLFSSREITILLRQQGIIISAKNDHPSQFKSDVTTSLESWGTFSDVGTLKFPSSWNFESDRAIAIKCCKWIEQCSDMMWDLLCFPGQSYMSNEQKALNLYKHILSSSFCELYGSPKSQHVSLWKSILSTL